MFLSETGYVSSVRVARRPPMRNSKASYICWAWRLLYII